MAGLVFIRHISPQAGGFSRNGKIKLKAVEPRNTRTTRKEAKARCRLQGWCVNGSQCRRRFVFVCFVCFVVKFFQLAWMILKHDLTASRGLDRKSVV